MDTFKSLSEKNSTEDATFEIAATSETNISPARMSELMIFAGTLVQSAVDKKSITLDELRFVTALLKGATELYSKK